VNTCSPRVQLLNALSKAKDDNDTKPPGDGKEETTNPMDKQSSNDDADKKS
jgi:hypothetical protein